MEYQPYASLGLAIELVQRLEADEDFRTRARKDPIGVLTGAGLPGDIARTLINWGQEGLAQAGSTGSCCDLTCWSSACPATCSVTAIGTTTCHCGNALNKFDEAVNPSVVLERVQDVLERSMKELNQVRTRF